MLPVAVASSASDENAIGDVIPVLYVTSCFHIRHAVYGDYGCQSAGGDAETGGISAFQLHPFMRCLPLTDIPRP